MKVMRLAVAASFLLGSMMVSASAQDLAGFYKDRKVTVIIGNWPASAYDLYARALARHMGKHLPGNPTFLPQNMPGAGSLKAANYLYNAAAKDGSVIASFASAALFESLFGNSAVQFDPAKFTWIGNMNQTIGTCIVSGSSGIETFDDLMKKETLFGATSAASNTGQHAYALKNLLGAKIKVITGYHGGNDVPLAMERNEVQGHCGASLNLLQSQLADEVKNGKIKPIVQLGIQKHPDLPNVAHIYDYAKTEDERHVYDLIFGRHVIGRPVLAPPGLPKDRAKALQDAFWKTMQDPEFLADAAKLKLEITPSPAAEVKDTLEKFLSYPKAIVERAEWATREN
jgi:tripartite-type tricarboxylate transporter receptor subunit TctC